MMSDRVGPARWLFDGWSRLYDLPLVQRLTYLPVHAAVLAALVDQREPPRRVLDVGCGTGLLAIRIPQALPGVRVVGCDFSLGMLRHAAAHGQEVSWVQGEAQRLPFRAASFDAVVSTEALHWFPDQHAAMCEFHRVLRPGGRLHVALVNPAIGALSDIAWLASRAIGQPFYWPTRQQMRALAEAAGFRVEAQRRVPRLPGGLLLPPVLTTAARP